MKVKCVDNGNGLLSLTVGKEYKVLVKTEQSYLVMNDDGLEQLYNKERFEVANEEEQQIKIQCDSCIHQQVCGHKTEWKNYCKEHIELRKKSVLFDVEPSCRYFIDKSVLEKKEEKTEKDKKAWSKFEKQPLIYTRPEKEVFNKCPKWDFKDKELNHVVEDTKEKDLKMITEKEFIKAFEKLLGLK